MGRGERSGGNGGRFPARARFLARDQPTGGRPAPSRDRRGLRAISRRVIGYRPAR